MYQHAISLFFIVGFVITPQSWSCKYDWFMVKGESTCRPCPKCPMGAGINKKCLATIIYDPGKIPECKPCIEGKTFSNYVSTDICYPCSEIIPNHRVVVKCTRFHDRRIECKHGYFDGLVLHQCNQQCCYCDEQSTAIKKCQKDKMKDGKVCAPKRKDGLCDPPTTTTTTTPSARSTATPKSESTLSTHPRPTSLARTTSTNPTTSHGETSITTTSSPIWSTRTPTTHHATSKSSSRPTSHNTTSPTETPKTGSGLSVNHIIVIVVVLSVATPVIIWLICVKLNPSNCQRQDNNSLLRNCVIGCTRYGSTDGNVDTEAQEAQQWISRLPKNHIYEDIKNGSATSSNATLECILMSPELPKPRRTPNSTVDSSRRNSEELLLLQPEPESRGNGESASSTRNSSRRNSQDCPPGSSSRRGRGPRLCMLCYRHRKNLAAILDPRGENIQKNWLEFGLYIASHNETLKEHVNRCHEYYYGGGSATLAMFWQLSMRNPFLKLKLFRETAVRFGRGDILEYLTKHNICNEYFFHIDEHHKTAIAFLLEKRKDGEKYWPEFADEFGFSNEDIAHFQEQKKTPQKYSPTQELIILLITHKPEITIDELQTAASIISRRDVYDCLEEIAQDLLATPVESST